MDQDVHFCELDGRRIAYATVGDGPLLVFGGRWVTHLEDEWADPHARTFFEELARSHRVVRYTASARVSRTASSPGRRRWSARSDSSR